MYVQEGGGWRELDVATRRGQTKLKQERDVHMINCINLSLLTFNMDYKFRGGQVKICLN